MYSEFIYFGTAAAAVGLSAIGVGIGQGLSSKAAIDAINQQPRASIAISRILFLGMALIETTAVLGALIAAALLVHSKQHLVNPYALFAAMGIGLAISLSGLLLSIVSSLPIQEACFSAARQPFLSQEIVRFMLVTVSLLQTPIIFGFIIAFIINNELTHIHSIRDSLRFIASGLSIGIGSIGPAIGIARCTQAACRAIGFNQNAYSSLFTFTLISQAIIETPIIFSLIIATLLIFGTPVAHENIIEGIIFLCIGITMGLGTMGPGISSGNTASAAIANIVYYPQSAEDIRRTSMFSQGIIETGTIYAFLMALVMLLLFIQ